MKIENGNLTILYWNGIPIKIHWTVILSALLISKFSFKPAIWIALFGLIFIHEVGHVFVIRSYKLFVEEIIIHGFGGLCRYRGYTSELKQSIIAWGGILLQVFVLIITLISYVIIGPPKSLSAYQIYHIYIQTNIFLIFINLLPFEPFDGAKAWRILNIGFNHNNRKTDKYKQQNKRVLKQIKKIMRNK